MHVFKLGATHRLSEIYDMTELRNAADSIFDTGNTNSFFNANMLDRIA
jgi:hypothetical protein